MNSPSRESLIHYAFSHSTNAINITDLYGTIIDVNEAYLKLYEFDAKEEIVGKKQNLIRSNKTHESTYKDMWKSILKGKIWRGELINKTAKGQEIFVYLTITPIYDDFNTLIGFMGFTLDRTEQVQLENQLLHANKLMILGTIGAGLAHELNNPLTSMTLEAEYLRDEIFNSDYPDAENGKQSINTVLHGIERMRKVVEHLMIYARKETDYEQAEISIHEIISDSMVFLNKQLANRNIQIDIQIETDFVVIANRTNLESVLHNLLTNSRDAFDNVKDGEKKILISICEDSDNFVKITFKDNAGGISSPHINKIFDPFFTTKSEGKGTGLGLSISRKIIVESGGKITCMSEGDKTTFEVLLPYQKKQNLPN